MIWPNCLLLFQIVQTIAHAHSQNRVLCRSALALVKFCQFQSLEYFDEDEVHELAFNLRTQGKQAGSSFCRALSLVDRVYVGYLQRIRVANLGKENLAKLCGETSREFVREFITNPRPADLIRGIQRAHRVGTKGTFRGDIVSQAYFNNAMLALETYHQTLYVYKEYVLFPNDDLSDYLPKCLKILKDFIDTKMVEFDFGATYPDTVICLSLLQYLKYEAFLRAEWGNAMSAGRLFKSALAALKNMQFSPKITHTYEEHKLKVCIMPQARKGPKSIPMSISRLENDTRMVRISILDVQHPNDPELVFKDLALE